MINVCQNTSFLFKALFSGRILACLISFILINILFLITSL